MQPDGILYNLWIGLYTGPLVPVADMGWEFIQPATFPGYAAIAVPDWHHVYIDREKEVHLSTQLLQWVVSADFAGESVYGYYGYQLGIPPKLIFLDAIDPPVFLQRKDDGLAFIVSFRWRLTDAGKFTFGPLLLPLRDAPSREANDPTRRARG